MKIGCMSWKGSFRRRSTLQIVLLIRNWMKITKSVWLSGSRIRSQFRVRLRRKSQKNLVLILQTFQYELTHPPAAWRNTGQTAGTVVVCFEPWFTFLLTSKKHRLQMVFVSQTEPTRHLLVYAAQMRVGKPLCFCCFWSFFGKEHSTRTVYDVEWMFICSEVKRTPSCSDNQPTMIFWHI